MVTGDDDPLGLWGGASFLWPRADAHFLLSGLWETRGGADTQALHFLGDGPTAVPRLKDPSSSLSLPCQKRASVLQVTKASIQCFLVVMKSRYPIKRDKITWLCFI